MNIDYVRSILPHRYPFLLVDGVIEESEDRIVAFKNISISDPVFQGHFPEYPIYPGVLIIEGLAQTAGILLLKDLEGIPLFLGIDEARFKKEVRPGDKLIYEVKKIGEKLGTVQVEGVAKVENTIVAKAKLLLGVKKK
ncbi:MULTISPECIES: 3-hydroxyacyl-ACP dehydratase FabZ [Thermotoga]|uniref:3-hydroxyacyl-[acyl-carrier-protein] dehydratase FabZ n=1 Tax=Thermotoga neapolitana (strain ATCC 49049 / DSM 4359 / NBRC 107923 / NS-E) TaxID=309803 RepID=FABZ_THENN|nr:MULTISPECIES: 3-hydroxyacyl-ACP dehydratase FabZ [Thermotoga]B9KAH0.1 RecName: Full=3-hydroxyacyl-[acyl-carrier-protein] dehydratase FabZ; AltName: Full=(3R)-hydroxymyristoyl-[acyl-carrier-protein] dehydratase; Short=(3R)-hydroxymyristoyl-ACP dehydrase; AltName: Full=Beta-hydroxyacyl-ACP dehydratase [Thermotoga neapolitana DSM 4359]MDK2785390.1 3-hydroxyacyl-[acyl-carrier-protein] dehydratase [Thermotoga sp.]HBF10638.1 beta-hydroxyacyl-ACP dehydratase [Thermotoga neapolitana]ACM23953.1 (3R)-